MYNSCQGKSLIKESKEYNFKITRGGGYIL